MADRTVRVELKADISDYTSGLAKAAAETRALGGNVDKQFKATTKTAKKRGEEAGGALSQGIQLGLVRNSPLIAAGIGGALAAGAPAVLAGAGVMFAGIGALAAAQTDEVKAAWTDLGETIRQGAMEDAAVLVPVFTGMASKLGEAFERLRPQLRDAFGALAPQIDTVVGSIIDAAETAVPALVRAVERGQPVMDGLASLIENIGTGLAAFMDAVSEHSGAAGTALDAIGDIVGALLPVLGELLGQGAELASEILPPLASALQAVADAAEVLGPLMPAIGAGFLALSAARGVGGALDKIGGKLGELGTKSGIASGALSGAGGAMTTLSGVAPYLGISIAGAGMILSRASEQADQWAEAIAAGGDAADDARAQMDDFGAAFEATNSGATGWLTSIVGLGTGFGATALAIDEANGKIAENEAKMSDLDIAQRTARDAQDALTTAVDRYGESSPQAAAAASAYRAAQAEVERQSDETEFAIHGVTQAMIDQANQALTAANSQLGYIEAQHATEQAQEALNTAIRDNGPASAEARDAADQLATVQIQQAEAAGIAAQEASGLGDSLEGQQIKAGATLQELYHLREEMGVNFPQAGETAIRTLERSGAAAGGVSANAQIAFQSIRNMTGGLINLGQQNPRPTVSVNDQASGTISNVGGLLAGIHDKSVTLTVNASVAAARASIASLGAGLLGGHAAGGYIAGPGSGTSDSIPARLSNGEYVVRAASVQQYGVGLLNAINSQRYAAGGVVGRETTGGGTGSGGVNVAAPQVKVYLDGQEWRGIARVEVDNALGSMADQQLYAGT